ncbi:DEXH-BOX ATP-DEPENDENT RNA HELICASE DEXH5 MITOCHONDRIAL [Salix koriyanagi]|uniref:RNA helicase n=1 Tax=Salix koriyanagi TaxID=2511006 RepID=A0A9Q0WUB5_9ROSI|nr:DEXH-BOX ATP-DEPENDENT RNA HELICASE DEXH5 MITOCHONDRIAL [Salix koriyanagi]
MQNSKLKLRSLLLGSCCTTTKKKSVSNTIFSNKNNNPLFGLLLILQNSNETSYLVAKRHGFCGYALEQFSDDEYGCDFESHKASSSVANVDEWKWKLSLLLRSETDQEIVSRDRKDRRDYEQLSNLARRMGLYSELYGKVVVASKVPLPNYRSDLDDKRPQREVVIPLSLQRRVEGLLQEHLDRAQLKAENVGGNADDANSIDQTEDISLDENRDSFLHRSVMERVLQRRSLRMRNMQRAWQESPEGRKMMDFRKSLPAFKEKERLLQAIAGNQVIVISGETGCGKTTQLPHGILLRRLLSDHNLNGITHVFVDEIHERGMNEDFLLIVLKDLLPRRQDLRLILMSATLNAELFSNYFGGAPTIHIPGFTYPVSAQFLEDVLEMTGYKLTSFNQVDDYGQEKMWKTQRQLVPRKRKNQITTLVEDALNKSSFENYSSRARKTRVLLVTCHGSMATSEQKLIFEKPPS